MNITPVDNSNNSFKGTIILNNLKRNSVETFVTNKQMDEKLFDMFQHVIVDEAQNYSSPQKILTNLKTYIKEIAQITDTKLTTGFKLPQAKDVTVIYSSSKEKSQLDVPDYFSITHIF